MTSRQPSRSASSASDMNNGVGDVGVNNDADKSVKKSRGRPSSFDREQLLLQVMDLFWEYGYKSLSFNEIAKAVQLTRASLYNAFESKQSMFLEALDCYLAASPDAVLADLKPGDNVGNALFSVLVVASNVRAEDKKRRGCLFVNCLNELVSSDDELGSVLNEKYLRRRDVMRLLVEQAIDQGELPADTDIKASANLMMSFVAGFNMFAKGDVSTDDLIAMSRVFLTNLGFQLSLEHSV